MSMRRVFLSSGSSSFRAVPLVQARFYGVLSKMPQKTSLKFTVNDGTGSLQSSLTIFANHGVNLSKLESRPSKRSRRDYEMYVDFDGSPADPKIKDLLYELRENFREVTILESKKVPWFPMRLKDLDRVARDVLLGGEDLESDHPGFNDEEYKEKRARIAKISEEYVQGHPIPRVDYSKDDVATWGKVYNKLRPLLTQHACREHVRLLPLLEENCGYSATNIPQLQDVSEFLQDTTGFSLRPVTGLLSSRNFLYGLAFRVFFSTQYIRHHSKPLYTPEPDICHELMGHVPLFADRDFADFSQEIGMASLGATDEQIEQLARCYWFSVEFGLCEENGERKAYGAGLLSSFGELEYSMTNEPEVRPFDPFNAAKQDFPITTYQPIYYSAQSFADARLKMAEFAESLRRPFFVRFDPYSRTIEVDSNVSPL